jgi:Terminase large subunit, T4likevirus-type, N-terminal
MSTLVADLLAAADPAEIAMRAGITPDRWQERFLRSGSDRILLNCSRQSGKSTMAAVRAVHTALYDSGSLTLLVSPSERQSGELAAKVRAVMVALDSPLPAEQQTALQLRLSNGSRIAALPGKEGTIRGYSGVRLLILDEAARVPDELVEAVRPMLAVSGGTMVMLSTPFGTRGAFYEAWKSRERWERFEVPATQVPRIPQNFLEEERRTMGQWAFAQEYLCQFMADAGAVFDLEDVMRAVDISIKPLGILGTDWQ